MDFNDQPFFFSYEHPEKTRKLPGSNRKRNIHGSSFGSRLCLLHLPSWHDKNEIKVKLIFLRE